ncbi:hypothetical protein Q664_38310 [Archangium violaceum Cb vi76]|uniref:Uncharacterized protein n=1 Tax=Archangium violaceum Cb vi76 TaxID=1406225 RepID=A0A084SKD0_9BACT|nr:hypothetical protein Q664_38310 [Archangium violaceum Cb vi76]
MDVVSTHTVKGREGRRAGTLSEGSWSKPSSHRTSANRPESTASCGNIAPRQESGLAGMPIGQERARPGRQAGRRPGP